MPDVCWPAKGDSDDLWAGLSGPSADFGIGKKGVFYGCVIGPRGHSDPGDCLDAAVQITVPAALDASLRNALSYNTLPSDRNW